MATASTSARQPAAAFKVKERDQSAFLAGGGTALVKVGPYCFEDGADTCIVSPSGSSARCE